MSCDKNPKLTNSWYTFPGREHSIVLNPGLGCECPFITTVVRCFVSSFTRKLSTLCVHNTFSFNNIQINHRSVFYCLHPTLSQCETPNRKKVLRDVLLQQQPKKNTTTETEMLVAFSLCVGIQQTPSFVRRVGSTLFAIP